MQTETFNNIDLLIEMAGSTLNIDDIHSELLSINKQIRNKRTDIEDLKSMMDDHHYFNASNELVDKNIEISLQNKINHLKRKIREIIISHEELKQEEKRMHEEIATLKDKLNKNEKYRNILDEKRKTSEVSAYYKDLYQEEEANVKILESELHKKESAYETLLKEIEASNQALDELNKKLEQEQNRLEDIRDNLNNPNAYIDIEKKKEDEEKLKELTESLEKLEKEKVRLLTDANMIGQDAKQLIIDNNYMAALSKIKELVTIVKSKPYMDVSSNTILEEELEKKEQERVSLSNLIDNKKYEGINSEAILKRIEYLNTANEKNKKEIEDLQLKNNEIDEEVNASLAPIIKELEEEVNTKTNTLEEYRTLLKEKDNSMKMKANLETAIIKKEKEKKILDGLLTSYKENLIAKIAKTNDIHDWIQKLEIEQAKNTKEKENLNKLTMLDLSTKDIIEEEQDKEKLHQINEEIAFLHNRKKYEKSPSEIYDQIEMQLASIANITPTKKEEEKKSLEPDNLVPEVEETLENKEEKIEELKEEEKNTELDHIKVVEMIPVETTTSEV